jgi:hypothetical protein
MIEWQKIKLDTLFPMDTHFLLYHKEYRNDYAIAYPPDKDRRDRYRDKYLLIEPEYFYGELKIPHTTFSSDEIKNHYTHWTEINIPK